MLTWLAVKLGLLPEPTQEQRTREAVELRERARESNARTLSAAAWSLTGLAVSTAILVTVFLIASPDGFHKPASAFLFSAAWGFGYYGWRNPHTWLRSVKRLIGRA
jgi:hypothetical protein